MFKYFHPLIAKIRNANDEKFLLAGFGLIYLLWNYSNFYIPNQFFINLASSRLDSSWMLGLNWASSLHLNWSGDSLVFTYGPLYYLDHLLIPEFHSHRTLVLTSIGMNLFYAACFTYVYSFFVDLKRNNRWMAFIVVVILIFQMPTLQLVPLFVAFMFIPIIFPNKNAGTNLSRYFRYGIMTLLLAILPFTKSSHMYESILFILVMTGFLLYSRKFLDAALMVILFGFFTVLTWVLATGQDVSSLFSYLASRFNISAGYTEAMMLGFYGPAPQILVLVLSFLIPLAVVFVYLVFTKKWKWATAWLLPLITLLLGFKASFVRADGGHAMLFIYLIILTALYYFYLLERLQVDTPEEPTSSWRPSAAQYLTPLLALITLSAFYFSGRSFTIHSELVDLPRLFSAEESNQANNKSNAAKAYNLDPGFLQLIDTKKTIDIIPWDIALLYAYNLRWSPRPVIQSYASYTATLDDLDANYFQRPDSPRQLIFALSSVDGHYLPFNTPHTFRTLLDNYYYVAQTKDKRFAFLKKRPESLSRNIVSISQKEYHFDQDIPIPDVQDGHVFMAAEIELTLLGKFLNAVYKPTTPYVEITLDTGSKVRHSFLRDTAKNGLFVSKYVRNMDDVQSVFSETYAQDIRSVYFIANTWLYNNSINVKFYKVPFNH